MTDQWEQGQNEVMILAREAIDHLYKRLRETPVFTLSGGTPAKIAGFFPPRVDPEGELTCGIDVILGEDRPQRSRTLLREPIQSDANS